uniref:glycerol-3-phosphate dehydrogenase n=1 Tax=Oreochromis aureus TaxID=47969 RepID=A0A668SRS5_OREAU
MLLVRGFLNMFSPFICPGCLLYPNVDVFPWLPLSDLKTAPVQGDDFSSGTSSRSTKLIHGGVRYLQKAIMKLDYKQVNASFFLRFLQLSRPLLGVTHIPLLWSCPPAAGQHNDARMNLAIALTAARYGAAIANYTEVVHLLERADPQTGKERVCGAHCRDVITGQEFDVRAKCVINATGPFTDALWKMDDQKNPDICQPSAGVHIVIPAITADARTHHRIASHLWRGYQCLNYILN